MKNLKRIFHKDNDLLKFFSRNRGLVSLLSLNIFFCIDAAVKLNAPGTILNCEAILLCERLRGTEKE